MVSACLCKNRFEIKTLVPKGFEAGCRSIASTHESGTYINVDSLDGRFEREEGEMEKVAGRRFGRTCSSWKKGGATGIRGGLVRAWFPDFPHGSH